MLYRGAPRRGLRTVLFSTDDRRAQNNYGRVMANSELESKYGAAALEAGRRLQGEAFERRLAQRDSLDQHFTKSWVDFAITGIGQRSQLDTRTRLLVLIGQYT